MVVLVFVRLFVGGLLCFFHRSADDGRLHRRRIVLFIVFGDCDCRRVETGGRAPSSKHRFPLLSDDGVTPDRKDSIL